MLKYFLGEEKMNKKVVLVTGSSRGLGKSIIEKFASNNYDVIINYLTHEKDALEFKEYIEEKYKVECLAIKANVSNDNDVKNMYDIIKNTFGNIDVLVNNAGICNDSEFDSKTKDDFIKIYEVNTYSVYLLFYTHHLVL